jgi:hypothetical protein
MLVDKKEKANLVLQLHITSWSYPIGIHRRNSGNILIQIEEQKIFGLRI